MLRLLFDIETDGFLEHVTQLHSLCIKNIETGQMFSCTDHPYTREGVVVLSVQEGLEMLQEAEFLAGHNVIKYDLPVLQKLFPRFHYRREAVLDTLGMARLIWPRDVLKETDFPKFRSGQMPGNLIGAHSLEAFGYRMGLLKGDYSKWCKEQGIDPWACWRPEMQNYCELDVEVTEALLNRLRTKGYAQGAVEAEHEVAFIVAEMERYGFPFDERAAVKLYAAIGQERDAAREALSGVFPPWYQADREPDERRMAAHEEATGKKRKFWLPAVKTPKRSATFRKGAQCVAGVPTHVTEGAPYTPVKLVEFNPASRDHIAMRLSALYGWEPEEYTEDGSAKVDETILSTLDYPEAKALSRYLLLTKRAGQISEGDEAWMKVVKPTGLIHHSCNPLGAVTRRATHSAPNIAQVPRVGSVFGAECRALFIARRALKKLLVGADLSGIELRMLAHYMSRWDGGAYARAVCEGTQEQGNDVHTLNCIALGLEPKKLYMVKGKQIKGRDLAKTFIYALLYGAGDEKIAMILGVSVAEAKRTKKRFFAALPALGKLIEAVQLKARSEKQLIGLDGGVIAVRSAHSALNTLLQSAGAIVAKYWLIEARRAYAARGWVHGEHYGLCAWVHDETQAEVNEDIADEFGQATVAAIATAGVRLNLRVPVTGEYKVGANWKDTH